MFLKTLQWRLVSFFCLIAICLIIPIGLFLNKSVEDRYYEEFKTNIDDIFNEWTLEVDDGATAEEVYSYLRDGRDITLFYIKGDYKSYTVVDMRDTSIIYSSDSSFNPSDKDVFFEVLLDSRNFVKAMSGGVGEKKILEHHDGKYFFDYARPLDRSRRDFVLYFRYYKDAWQPFIDSFNKIIFSSLLIAFLIAFILGYMLSKTVTVPIVRIMHKARDIASGNFDMKLDVKSDDEIGNLTKAFNYMAGSLKNTLIEISSEKNKIETILNYMTDGVIAFNLKGEVIHTNPASRRILDLDGVNNTYDDYARKLNLDISIEDILNSDTAKNSELRVCVNGRILRVYFAVFTGESQKPEGVIAVLQDITEQQKLEDMRKEFVANVSHELKTPITSIKSYAETLLDGTLEDKDTAQRFIKVICSEANRMARLVKDLLQLSRIDSNQMQWRIRDVSFVELARGCVEKMGIEASNKKQLLECIIADEPPLVKADYERMEQVVLNILSNAIKYTPEGGRICVHVGKTYNEAYVKVEDNGIGIPEQEISRIFERFYRVDKARSRELGGTGLGLAIAKEIVEAHGGSISLKSELGKGTEVIVKLPAAQPAA